MFSLKFLSILLFSRYCLNFAIILNNVQANLQEPKDAHTSFFSLTLTTENKCFICSFVFIIFHLLSRKRLKFFIALFFLIALILHFLIVLEIHTQCFHKFLAILLTSFLWLKFYSIEGTEPS